jgi:hypothetical protein
MINYCSLCGSGVALDTWDRFGVSGLVYQSDVLLYERQSETLWSQLMMQAVSTPRRRGLCPLPLEHGSWCEITVATSMPD